MKFCVATLITSTALLLAMGTEAFAYIDPGSGSVVTTAILGFFAAAVYTARKYLYKISDLFSRGSQKKERPE